jgi:Sugar (pentulose and hexulose) kinases
LILAIDIGTSSVRAALYDDAGAIIPKTLIKNERRLRQTEGGGSEIDAQKALLQLVSTIDDVLRAAEKIPGQISHVATSCFWHSLVGVDEFGKPTTNVLSWADNRSRNQVAVLRRRFDEAEIHNRTGARFHSSFWPAKLLWLRNAEAEAFARTARWLSLSDYLALKLFDDSTTSISMASATGIFDIRKCMWDAQLLKFLKLKTSNLPPLAGDDQTFRLNRKFARRWERLARAEWFPAIGDGAANNIGSGCVSKELAALMVGTSGAMRVVYKGEPPKKIPTGLWCYRIDRQRVVLGGALSDGGGLYEWLKEILQLPASAERIIAKRPPAEHGLTFLPFLAGERSTGYHENATGCIVGLTPRTDAIDIAQAAMESVGYRFAEIFDQLSEVTDINEIVASGGALRASEVWTQMIADILGRKITLIDVPEASLRGVTLLALEGIANIKKTEEFSTVRGKVFEPNLAKNRVFIEEMKKHKTFYDLVNGKY